MFIIVWRGLGIFVPVVMIVCIAATNYIVDVVMKNPDFSKWHYWPKALGAIVAALAVWLIGRYLHSRPGELVIEQNTAKAVTRAKVHSLFGIRFEYWAFLPSLFRCSVILCEA